MTSPGELVISPAVERAVTEVKLGCEIAFRFPRDEGRALDAILRACAQPTFAEAAVYNVPRGKKRNEATGAWEENFIEGLSIRFAEEAMRLWRHLHATASIVFDDDDRQVVAWAVWDCEANSRHAGEFTVRKTVERKNGKGRDVVGERVNSYGDKVAICRATDEEVENKRASLYSKAIRNAILRHIPSHVKEACLAQITETERAATAGDIEAKRARCIEALGALKVTPDQISDYIGNPVQMASAEQLVELGRIYRGMKETGGTWADYAGTTVVEPERAAARPRQAKPSASPHDGKASRLPSADDVRAAIRDIAEEISPGAPGRIIKPVLDHMGLGDLDSLDLTQLEAVRVKVADMLDQPQG